MAIGNIVRTQTFFVDTLSQRNNLAELQRHTEHLAEAYRKNKPLCFQSRSYQRQHPAKAAKGCRDADATLEAPLILGVADGVSQVEDFGIDSSALPREILSACEELGMCQLMPSWGSGDSSPSSGEARAYHGPMPLVQEAFHASESLGSTTLALAVLDNSTRIHGKLHPMIGAISIGDCQLLVLRRLRGPKSWLQPIFNTEMQRIGGQAQAPLQLARVDARIDPDFHEGVTEEVIEKGSAVHSVSAYEGDILVMGSDGVFDNLFLEEIAELCNEVLPPGGEAAASPIPGSLLARLAERIVEASHAKTCPGPDGVSQRKAPIGPGGKADDTCCVVAEVVEWTEAHGQAYSGPGYGRRPAATALLEGRYRWLRWWNLFQFLTCGAACSGEAADLCEAISVEAVEARAEPK